MCYLRRVKSWLIVALVCSSVACGEEATPTTEWTPADHAQPAERQVDPRQQVETRTERSENPRARAAMALWNVSCAACHGRTGAGDGPQAPPELLSLLEPEWQEAKSDEDIARVIAQGRGMMPPFGDTIQPQGIAALVELIRAFGAAASHVSGSAPPDSAPSPGPGPVDPSQPLPPGHP